MIKKYFKESFAELHNVSWPTKKQATKLTTIVFIFMILSAAALGVVDYLFSVGFRQLINL